MQNLGPWMSAVRIPANHDSVWILFLGTCLVTAHEGDTIECHGVGECEVDVCMRHTATAAIAVLPLFTTGQELFSAMARWRASTAMVCKTDFGCIQCDGLLVRIRSIDFTNQFELLTCFQVLCDCVV